MRDNAYTTIICMHLHLAPVLLPWMWRRAHITMLLHGFEAYKSLTPMQQLVASHARLIAVSSIRRSGSRNLIQILLIGPLRSVILHYGRAPNSLMQPNMPGMGFAKKNSLPWLVVWHLMSDTRAMIFSLRCGRKYLQRVLTPVCTLLATAMIYGVWRLRVSNWAWGAESYLLEMCPIIRCIVFIVTARSFSCRAATRVLAWSS